MAFTSQYKGGGAYLVILHTSTSLLLLRVLLLELVEILLLLLEIGLSLLVAFLDEVIKPQSRSRI
jgi:hypothetical protein